MKAVFELSTPKNDLEGASVPPSGQFTMPAFSCDLCGCDGSTSDVWYASLQPTIPEAMALASEIPQVVCRYEDYVTIRDKSQRLLRTTKRLLPGSVIGARPIEVKSRNYIGGLTLKKLRDGIDFIAAGCNWIVSARIAEVLRNCRAAAFSGALEFRGGGRAYTGWTVIELEPRLVLTETERQDYGYSVCPRCGSSVKSSNKSTFALRRFDSAIFDKGCVVARSAETRMVYINEALRDCLADMRASGVAYEKAGDWI